MNFVPYPFVIGSPKSRTAVCPQETMAECPRGSRGPTTEPHAGFMPQLMGHQCPDPLLHSSHREGLADNYNVPLEAGQKPGANDEVNCHLQFVEPWRALSTLYRALHTHASSSYVLLRLHIADTHAVRFRVTGHSRRTGLPAGTHPAGKPSRRPNGHGGGSSGGNAALRSAIARLTLTAARGHSRQLRAPER